MLQNHLLLFGNFSSKSKYQKLLHTVVQDCTKKLRSKFQKWTVLKPWDSVLKPQSWRISRWNFSGNWLFWWRACWWRRWLRRILVLRFHTQIDTFELRLHTQIATMVCYRFHANSKIHKKNSHRIFKLWFHKHSVIHYF